jgi:hypothetical protein
LRWEVGPPPPEPEGHYALGIARQSDRRRARSQSCLPLPTGSSAGHDRLAAGCADIGSPSFRSVSRPRYSSVTNKLTCPGPR